MVNMNTKLVFITFVSIISLCAIYFISTDKDDDTISNDKDDETDEPLESNGNESTEFLHNVGFLVGYANTYNGTHDVQMIISDDSTTIHSSTFQMDGNSGGTLYQNHSLPEMDYTVEFIVDGNWTESIIHQPDNDCFVHFNIQGQDKYYVWIDCYD